MRMGATELLPTLVVLCLLFVSSVLVKRPDNAPELVLRTVEGALDKTNTMHPKLDKTGCQVDDCGSNGGTCESSNTCVFPFIYGNRIFKTCTQIDDDPAGLWCATSVDGNGNMETWAYCQDNCPGFSSAPIQEHPDNEEGSCSCGVPNVMNRNRIVGGSDTLTAEFPWQVALLFGGESLQRQGCGGTLVGREHVITAAHCTFGDEPSDIFVNVGDTVLGISADAESSVIGVKTIINHPNYDPNDVQFDISILELNEAVNFLDNPHIKPACLPERGSTFTGQEAVITGWGTIDSGEPLVAHLLSTVVEIFADDDCGQVSSQITTDMICAGVKEGGRDTCQGDSGGPMIAKDSDNNGAATLVGVVSWGYGCAEAGSPGVYAEVSHFADWLDENMPNLRTCSPPASSDWEIGEDGVDPVDPVDPPVTTCAMKNKIPAKLKRIKILKAVKKVEDCIKECEQDPGCEYYKWKTSKKASKRTCELMKMTYKSRNKFYSGPLACKTEEFFNYNDSF